MAGEMESTILASIFVGIFVYLLVHWLTAQKRAHNAEIQRLQIMLETQKLQQQLDAEKRKDELEDKKIQRDHDIAMNGQEHMYAILKDTCAKIEKVDISQAAYFSLVMQNLQTGGKIDPNTLDTVSGKIPNAPLTILPLPRLENPGYTSLEGSFHNQAALDKLEKL